jgi:hypothetical protein
MPWYVFWAPTPPNGRLGYFLASPTLLAVGQKATAFCWRAHRTVRCTPDKHCSLSGALSCQPTVEVCSSRPLFDCPVHTGQSGAAAQGRLSAGPFAQTVRVSHRTVRCTADRVLFTVRCATRALADCALHGFIRWFFGFLLFLSFGLLSSFYVFFWDVASSMP